MHFLPKNAIVQHSKTTTANTIGMRVALGFLFSTKKDQIGMHFLPKKAVVQPSKIANATAILVCVALGFLFSTKNYQTGVHFLSKKAVVQPSKTATATAIRMRIAIGFLFSTEKDNKDALHAQKGSRAALEEQYCNCNRYARCAWIFIQH